MKPRPNKSLKRNSLAFTLILIALLSAVLLPAGTLSKSNSGMSAKPVVSTRQNASSSDNAKGELRDVLNRTRRTNHGQANASFFMFQSSTPAISSISPNTVSPGTFSLTVNGSNFNTSNAQIIVTGPNCPTATSCVVPNGVLNQQEQHQTCRSVDYQHHGELYDPSAEWARWHAVEWKDSYRYNSCCAFNHQHLADKRNGRNLLAHSQWQQLQHLQCPDRNHRTELSNDDFVCRTQQCADE